MNTSSIYTNKEKNKLNKISDSVQTPRPDRTSYMYKIHKYWARKPWYLVNAYINEFSEKGDIVFDPFSGSGVAGIEALVSGRKSVLVDLNPIATFVSEMTVVNHRIENEIKRLLRDVESKLKDRLLELYQVDRACSKCSTKLVGKHFERGPKFKKVSAYIYCPKCGASKTGQDYLLTKSDLSKLNKVEKTKISSWYPKNQFPKKFDKDRITYKGIKTVDKLFTKRNLLALSTLLSEIEKIDDRRLRNLFKLSFSDTVLHASKLKGVNVRPLSVNNYWVPDDWIEENVWFRFRQRIGNLIKGKRIASDRLGNSNNLSFKVFNQSSTDLSNILDDQSVDFIFTDPPYGDSIQYDELSIVWNSWLKNDFESEKEIVVNRSKGKSVSDYEELLNAVFLECFRVLKKNKYMLVTFHNKEFRVWIAILRSIRNAGFEFIGLNSHLPMGNSYNKNWAKRSPKTDFYMLFQRNGRKESSKQLLLGISEMDIRELMEKYLARHKNNSLPKVYDYVLENAIEHVFRTENFDELKNLDVYLIDKILKEYDR